MACSEPQLSRCSPLHSHVLGFRHVRGLTIPPDLLLANDLLSVGTTQVATANFNTPEEAGELGCSFVERQTNLTFYGFWLSGNYFHILQNLPFSFELLVGLIKLTPISIWLKPQLYCKKSPLYDALNFGFINSKSLCDHI